jgi:integration host factor subunit beta
VTRRELEREVASRCNVPLSDGMLAVETLLSSIEEALCGGRRVELRGFGSLRARHYSRYKGRNPNTGCSVEVPPKVVAVFRPAKALVERVNEEER